MGLHSTSALKQQHCILQVLPVFTVKVVVLFNDVAMFCLSILAWEAIYIFIFLSQNNDLEIGMKSISAKKYIIEDHILLIA